MFKQDLIKAILESWRQSSSFYKDAEKVVIMGDGVNLVQMKDAKLIKESDVGGGVKLMKMLKNCHFGSDCLNEEVGGRIDIESPSLDENAKNFANSLWSGKP